MYRYSNGQISLAAHMNNHVIRVNISILQPRDFLKAQWM